MKTIYRLDEKRISKKALIEDFGADRIKRLTEEAKETFREDPLIANDFFMGGFYGMLNIEFKF